MQVVPVVGGGAQCCWCWGLVVVAPPETLRPRCSGYCMGYRDTSFWYNYVIHYCRIRPEAVADLPPPCSYFNSFCGALPKEGKTSIQPKISISYIYDHLCNLCEKEFWTHGFMKFLRRWPTKEQSWSITGCDAIECSFFRGTLRLYSFPWIFLTIFDFSILSWLSNIKILRMARVIYLCKISGKCNANC